MKFLVDANIPKGIAEFEGADFMYVYQWGDGASDTEIWDYSIKHNLIIITRDSDFYFRMITSIDFPKVIFLNLQQINKPTFKLFINENWNKILSLIADFDMLIIDLENIQLIKK
jgi:predicted nuclease of predicted toxin-antitoxin system